MSEAPEYYASQFNNLETIEQLIQIYTQIIKSTQRQNKQLTMDELKNLVIQTLETNGILGQLRAQLRSCVFKVIDNQEQVEKGQSSFHWENPQAKKVMQTASGVVCAELIREFLEFYRLDYSLQIYVPEVNLSGTQPMNKDDLARRSGLGERAEGKPIMMQLLESFLSGDREAAPKGAMGSPVQQNSSSLFDPPAPVTSVSQVQNKRRDDFDDDSSQKDSKRGSPDLFANNNRSVNAASANAGSKKSRIELASQLVEEVSQEERQGYRAEIDKSSMSKNSQSQQSPSPVAPPSRQQVAVAPKEKSNEFADNYNDDFDDDIVEDIQDNIDDTDNLQGSGNNFQANNVSNQNAMGGAGQHRSTFISESAGGITVSQSLGVDPSVDSLALEDYDHIEPVERVNY